MPLPFVTALPEPSRTVVAIHITSWVLQVYQKSLSGVPAEVAGVKPGALMTTDCAEAIPFAAVQDAGAEVHAGAVQSQHSPLVAPLHRPVVESVQEPPETPAKVTVEDGSATLVVILMSFDGLPVDMAMFGSIEVLEKVAPELEPPLEDPPLDDPEDEPLLDPEEEPPLDEPPASPANGFSACPEIDPAARAVAVGLTWRTSDDPTHEIRACAPAMIPVLVTYESSATSKDPALAQTPSGRQKSPPWDRPGT